MQKWDAMALFEAIESTRTDVELLFLFFAFIDEHRARALLFFRSSSTYTWRTHGFFSKRIFHGA